MKYRNKKPTEMGWTVSHSIRADVKDALKAERAGNSRLAAAFMVEAFVTAWRFGRVIPKPVLDWLGFGFYKWTHKNAQRETLEKFLNLRAGVGQSPSFVELRRWKTDTGCLEAIAELREALDWKLEDAAHAVSEHLKQVGPAPAGATLERKYKCWPERRKWETYFRKEWRTRTDADKNGLRNAYPAHARPSDLPRYAKS